MGSKIQDSDELTRVLTSIVTNWGYLYVTTLMVNHVYENRNNKVALTVDLPQAVFLCAERLTGERRDRKRILRKFILTVVEGVLDREFTLVVCGSKIYRFFVLIEIETGWVNLQKATTQNVKHRWQTQGSFPLSGKEIKRRLRAGLRRTQVNFFKNYIRRAFETLTCFVIGNAEAKILQLMRKTTW